MCFKSPTALSLREKNHKVLGREKDSLRFWKEQRSCWLESIVLNRGQVVKLTYEL